MKQKKFNIINRLLVVMLVIVCAVQAHQISQQKKEINRLQIKADTATEAVNVAWQLIESNPFYKDLIEKEKAAAKTAATERE